MDGASDEFLAGAGFAGDEDGDVGGTDFVDLFEDAGHRPACTDKAWNLNLCKHFISIKDARLFLIHSEMVQFKTVLCKVK